MSFVNVAIAGYSALSQYGQGQADKASANTQADALDFQARQEEEASQQQAQIIRRAGRYAVARAEATYAGAGVRVDTGSPLEVDQRINTDVEHDATMAILNGTRRAIASRTQGSLTRIQGDLAATNAELKAYSTVLGGAWQGMKGMGWRTQGPGFSGTQSPAPVVNRDFSS